MNQKIRVRFAPSPTGPLHIGGLRTALYNFLFARKHSGTFVLRIEDTDQTRYVEGAEDYIQRSLEWVGLTPDEGPSQGGDFGPYRQSERRSIYKKHIDQLVANGLAYYAFDTVEELDAMRQREIEKGNQGPKYDYVTRQYMKNSLTLSPEETERMLKEGVPYTVRLKVPEDRIIEIVDEIRETVRFNTKELDDKVLLKADGLPTYHLANVVDDHLMQISHVIRGEEWLSSTAHHILLYEALGWKDEIPVFAHLPLILKPSGKGKLSKRDGQQFGFPVFPLAWTSDQEKLEGFDSFGFHPDAVINFLAFLGWNPGTEQELFSTEALIEAFHLNQIGKSGARFDYDKALWYNSQYLSKAADTDLTKAVSPFMQEAGIKIEETELLPVVQLMKDRIQTYRDFPQAASYFFTEPTSYNIKLLRKKWKEPMTDYFPVMVTRLEDVTKFEEEPLKEVVTGFMEENELKFGDVLPLLRIALSGDTKGPDLFAMMEVMGRQKVLTRLKAARHTFDRLTQSEEP